MCKENLPRRRLDFADELLACLAGSRSSWQVQPLTGAWAQDIERRLLELRERIERLEAKASTLEGFIAAEGEK